MPIKIFSDFAEKIKDFVKNLTNAEEEVEEELEEKIHIDYFRAAIEIGKELQASARYFAPDGGENLDEYPTRDGQRPSARFGYDPINTSLEYRVGYDPSGFEIFGEIFEARYNIRIVAENSPHAKYFTKGVPEMYTGGTKEHRIPSTGTMKGNKGYPMTFFFQRQKKNWAVWTQIGIEPPDLHPGIDLAEEDDFILNAVEEVRPMVSGIIEDYTY